MRFDVLAKILEDAGLGRRGESIFVYAMPAEVTKGILVRGPLQGIPVDPTLPGYYKADIQAIVRDVRHLDGDTRAKQVTDALTTMQSKIYADPDDPNLPVIQLKQMYLEMLPIVYPRSVGNGLEFSLNLKAAYVML